MNKSTEKIAIRQLLDAGATIRKDGRWWHGQHCLGFTSEEALTNLGALRRLAEYCERHGRRHYRPASTSK